MPCAPVDREVARCSCPTLLSRAARPPGGAISSLGQRGERAAERYLRRLGYKIVARRERGPLGELDLVAVDGRTVVFVEVKTRRSHDAGHPAEAVGAEKQRRLTRLALAYLKRHDLLEYTARFDVVAVTWPDDARKPHDRALSKTPSKPSAAGRCLARVVSRAVVAAAAAPARHLNGQRSPRACLLNLANSAPGRRGPA